APETEMRPGRGGRVEKLPDGHRTAEQEHVRRRAPHEPGAARRHALPAVLRQGNSVHQHGVLAQAAERLETRQLTGCRGVRAFAKVEDERYAGRRGEAAVADPTSGFAAGSDGTVFEC